MGGYCDPELTRRNMPDVKLAKPIGGIGTSTGQVQVEASSARRARAMLVPRSQISFDGGVLNSGLTTNNSKAGTTLFEPVPGVRSGPAATEEQKDPWTTVRRKPRNYRARIDLKEESKVLVWGVHPALEDHQVLRSFREEGAKIDMFAAWAGEGVSLRVELTMKSYGAREETFGSLQKLAKKLGWRAARGWHFEEREKRRNQLLRAKGPAAPRVPEDKRKAIRPKRAVQESKNFPRVVSTKRRLKKNVKSRRRGPGLRLACQNACSLAHPGRFEEFTGRMEISNIDILAVSESKHTKHHMFVTNNYVWLPGNPTDGKSGGVGFIVAKYLAPYMTKVKESIKGQAWISLRADSRHKQLDLCAAYMPQEAETKTVRSEKWVALQDECLKRTREGHDVMVMGDLNAKVGRPTDEAERVLIGEFGEEKRTKNGWLMLNMLRHAGMASANCRVKRAGGPNGGYEYEYTRMNASTGKNTVIDYALYSNSMCDRIKDCKVDYTNLSVDHQMLVVNLHCPNNINRPLPVVRQRYCVDKLYARAGGASSAEEVEQTVNAYQMKLADLMTDFEPAEIAEQKTDQQAVDKVVAEWERRVSVAADQIVGKKTVKHGISKKWFDDEVRQAIKTRREQHTKWCETRKPRDWVEYCKLRKEVGVLVREKKKLGWSKLLEQVKGSYGGDKKLFWSLVKKLKNHRKIEATATSAVKNKLSNVVTSPEDRREAWAEFYEDLGKAKTHPTPGRYDDEFKRRVEEEVEEFSRESTNNVDGAMDAVFTTEELQGLFKLIPTGKATGGDLIPNELMIKGGDAMVESIRKLFNWIREVERLPKRWLRGIIVTLFKKGSREDPGNYRGISLLCHIGKLFAKLISKRLYDYLEDAGKICDEQGGFRRKRSTIDQAYILHETLMRRKHQGKSTFCFFLDVRKAFDTVWQDGLWKKLYVNGVKGKLWRLIRALYKDTESCVLVDGVQTRWFGNGVESQGVRQGCPLSTILFAMFVNGLAKELNDLGLGLTVGVRALTVLLFADDVVLTAANPEDLQKMIAVIAEYSRKWRFEEHIGKCAVLRCKAARVDETEEEKQWNYCGTKETKTRSKHWTFLGKKVPTEKQYKYLGLWIEQGLGWELHAKKMVEKGHASADGMARIYRNRAIPARIRLETWKVLGRTQIEYGTELWDTSTTQANALEAIQQKVLTQILQCNRNTNREAVRGECGVISLENRRRAAKLHFHERLKNMDEKRLAHHTFVSEPGVAHTGGRRQRNWKERMEEAMEHFDIDEDNMKEEASCKPLVLAKMLAKETKIFSQACQEKPRMKVLGLLKQEPRMEDWVGNEVLDGVEILRLKLRLGTSGLRADAAHGRYADKTCRSCNHQHEENVRHFLLHCEGYAEERKASFEGFNATEKTWWETSEQDVRLTAMLTGSPSEDIGLEAKTISKLKDLLAQTWKKRNDKLHEWSERNPSGEETSSGTDSSSGEETSSEGDSSPDEEGEEETIVRGRVERDKSKISSYFAPTQHRLNFPNCPSQNHTGQSPPIPQPTHTYEQEERNAHNSSLTAPLTLYPIFTRPARPARHTHTHVTSYTSHAYSNKTPGQSLDIICQDMTGGVNDTMCQGT